MRIVVVGATGMIGSRVAAEAAARGHAVIAASRRPGDAAPVDVVAVAADATDLGAMVALFARADAVVAATRPPTGGHGGAQAATTTLLDAAAASGRRLVVVGGAGALRLPGEPGRLVLDAPAHVPPAWRPIAAASVAQLDACRAHRSADWVYVSPPALIAPGERTGAYRRGTTTLLLDPDGRSSISAEDFAVAVVDELEAPGGERHVTVAQALAVDPAPRPVARPGGAP